MRELSRIEHRLAGAERVARRARPAQGRRRRPIQIVWGDGSRSPGLQAGERDPILVYVAFDVEPDEAQAKALRER